MKHLKAYEKLNNNIPQIGDYVLCDPHDMSALFGTNTQKKSLKHFIENNVGIITKITPEEITVEYHNIPYTIQDNFFMMGGKLSFDPDEIIISSSNMKDIKKEYELRLTSNKYNL